MHIYLSELGPEHIPEIINGKGVLPSLFVLICTRNSNTHSSKKQKHTRRLWCPRKTAPRPRVEDYLANHCQQWLSEGTATCSQTLHELLFPLLNQSSHISCPAATFTQLLLFSLTSLQLGPAFPPCLQGALVSVTHVCVCVCTCTLWPQGSQIPRVGDQELVQVFWSDFARLSQSCVNSVCSRG